MSTVTTKLAAAATTIPLLSLGVASSDSVDAQPMAEEHCLVEIVGVNDGGRFETDEPVCYPTLAEVLVELGEVPSFRSRSTVDVDAVVAAASTTLGVHWDGSNRTGSSITISGGTCGGGYVNLSSSWTNRISSTLNSCPSVVFWDGFDKTGSNESTNSASTNLGALNNASNSIGYAS